MSARADIWMPLYIGDYLADTMHLTTEQHGAYLLLLMHYWRTGKLPNNDRALAQIARCSEHTWSTARPVLVEFFKVEDGRWVQKRVEEELKAAQQRRTANVEKARAAAEARWKKGRGEDAQSDASSIACSTDQAQLEDCPSSSSSSSQSSSSAPPASDCEEAPPPAPHAKPKKPQSEAKSGLVWQAYATAYFDRYGTEPVRNAKVNGQLAKLVDYLGEEAPAVAAFYVRHNNRYYVQRGHAVDHLLLDHGKLRTEWATNRQITETQARQADQTQARGNVFTDILEDHRNGKLDPGARRHG